MSRAVRTSSSSGRQLLELNDIEQVCDPRIVEEYAKAEKIIIQLKDKIRGLLEKGIPPQDEQILRLLGFIEQQKYHQEQMEIYVIPLKISPTSIARRMLNDALVNAIMFLVHRSEEVQETLFQLEQNGYKAGEQETFNQYAKRYGRRKLLNAIKQYTDYVDYVASAVDNDPKLWADYVWITDTDEYEYSVSFEECCEQLGYNSQVIRKFIERAQHMDVKILIEAIECYKYSTANQEDYYGPQTPATSREEVPTCETD